MVYLPLIINWVVFGFVHSITASSICKIQFEKWMGKSFKLYRLAFNFIAICNLILVLYYHFQTPNIAVFQSSYYIKFLGFVLMAIGSILLIVVFKSYDMYEFTGLDVFQSKIKPQKLVQNGLSKKVRHPMYLGLLVLLLGGLIYEPSYRSLVSFLAVFIYLQIGIFFEERKLVRTFGAPYIEYKKKTPKLFPKIARIKF